ncbi:MAG TPA: VOC family protein [Casimicrobiaceae bacterium]
MSSVAFDHLIVAAQSLADGCDFIEARLGVRPQPGGKHVAMGTHNALVGLGSRQYLEVIAIDPEGQPPARPRWFDLDEPRMRASLAEGPRLIHWAVRTDDIEAAKAHSRIDQGVVHAMTRGDFRWSITFPDDGHLPGAGLVPTLIQWTGAKHPTDHLADSGIRVVTLAGEHPDPAPIRTALGALGLSDTLKVTYGQYARLAAMLRTPQGIVTL